SVEGQAGHGNPRSANPVALPGPERQGEPLSPGAGSTRRWWRLTPVPLRGSALPVAYNGDGPMVDGLYRLLLMPQWLRAVKRLNEAAMREGNHFAGVNEATFRA